MAPTPGRGLSGNMRRLHVVGFSPDHRGFVLATRKGAKTGAYLLPLDDTLVSELERARAGTDEDRPAPPEPRRTGSGSSLSPREIQARLRSGRTVEEVAAEAGVGTDWVDRFAAPVLAEQAAAVERAGRAVLHTPRKGPSDRPLEVSLLRNLSDRGVSLSQDEMERGWAARQLMDSDWLVSFSFRNRGRVMTAEWMLNQANGALTSRNRLGTELGYLDPGLDPADAAVAVAPPAPTRRAPAPKAAFPKAAAPKAPARRTTAPATPPAPPAVERRPAPPAAPSRSVPAKTAAGVTPPPPARPAGERRLAPPAAPPRSVPAKTAAAVTPPPPPAKTPPRRVAAASAPARPEPAAAPEPEAAGPRPPGTSRRVAAAPKPGGLRAVPVTRKVLPRPAGAHFVRETTELPVVPGPVREAGPAKAAGPAKGAGPAPKSGPARDDEPGGDVQLAFAPIISAPTAASNGRTARRPDRPLRAARLPAEAPAPEERTTAPASPERRGATPLRFGEED